MAKKTTKKKPARKKRLVAHSRVKAKQDRARIVALADPDDNFRAEGRGRDTTYKIEYAKQAASMCKLGATDLELADHFEVTVRTIKNWEKHHPSFFKALRRGKAAADERVERALYSRAMGYSYESEKLFFDAKNGEVVRAETIEHVPPSDTAISLWLRNRKPAEWRDRVDHDHTHSHTLFKQREDEMSVAEAQAVFRQIRNMPLEDLQRTFKMIEAPKTIDNETGDVIDEDIDA